MSKIVPLISSGIAGPLGVLHLPRLWLKVSLEAAGKLHPDYPGIGHGYDSMVLSALGIAPEAFKTFVSEKHPTYPQLEAWILEQKGGALDQVAVAKLNAAITGYLHDPETCKSILEGAGVADEAGKIRDAVNLNNLDDWQIFWSEVLSK
jgi:hypothetical protein